MSSRELPERVVAASARRLTRKRFLRRAGSLALGGVVAGAYVLRGPDARAACNWNIAPCVGAPLCGGFRCNNYSCDINSNPHTHWACYTSNTCCPNPGTQNCWCNGGNRCCDCCAYDAGCKYVACTNSSCGGGNHWRCICRGSCT